MILPFLLVIALPFVAATQTPDIPKDYELKEKEDYLPYEGKVMELVRWLHSDAEQTAADKKAASKFVFDWTNGCPYVSVALHQKVFLPIMDEKHPIANELLMAYQFGMTLYILENKAAAYKGIEPEVQAAGIRAMNGVYERYLALGGMKSRTMKKYGKLITKGKLVDWVRKNVPFQGG